MIGQAPSKSATKGREIEECLMPMGSGDTADRLVKYMGVTPEVWRSTTERLNVVPFYSGRLGEKGDVFPSAMAREHAKTLLPMFYQRRVLILGVATAWSFRCPFPALEWWAFKGAEVCWVPHTSGVNRWWNDEANRKAGSEFLQTIGDKLNLGGV